MICLADEPDSDTRLRCRAALANLPLLNRVVGFDALSRPDLETGPPLIIRATI